MRTKESSMPIYAFKLILAGPEAAQTGLDKALYDQFAYADTDAHLQGCDGLHSLDCSREAPSLKEAVFAAVDEMDRIAPAMVVLRVQVGPDLYSEADRWFAMNPPRGRVLSKLVRDHGRGSQDTPKDLPPLTEEKLKRWIANWYYRTGSLPTADSGACPGLDGKTWGDINRYLANGNHSLKKFIALHWGEEFGTSLSPMTFVRCAGMTFRLGSVLAMTCGEAMHGEKESRYVEMKTCLKLLISGVWVTFWGEQAERLHDYLTQAWTSQRDLVDLDASPPAAPLTAAESPSPAEPESAPEPGPLPIPEPEAEPEKRRFFL
jgi:hypothetical protein